MTATYGDTDKSVNATTDGNGEISYTVKAGSEDYISVASDGKLTIKKVPADGKAYVTVTASETNTGGTDGNGYAAATKDVTVNISKATVTITAKDQSIYVGGTVPTLSGADFYTVTGLVGEETLTTNPTLAYQKNGSAVTPDNTTAGTYDIVPFGAAAGDNYAISYTNGTLTITARNTQTITASDVTATYGDTDKSVNATTDGNGEISYTVKAGSENYIDVNTSTGALTIKAVPADGKAYVTVKATETTTGGTGDKGYAAATKDVTVNISKATVTITAKDQSIYVGGTVPTLSGSDFYTVTGLVGEDTLTTAPTLAYQKDGSAATPDNTAAGTYDIVASGASAGDNYAISYTKGTLTISEKQPATVTKAPTANTLTYNGQAQALVTAGEATGGEMQYALGTKDAATEPYTTSIPAKTDAGTYYVWYKAVSDEDHSDSKPACITVTISKPAVAPAPADEEKGEANFKPSAAAPDVKGVEQEAIKTQMEELAKADDTKLKAGQVKEVTVNMETKAVAESDVPKKEASAIKETAEGMIPAKDRESTKCDFLDIAVSKIVIVYDVKNGQKVKNESDSISAGLTNLAQVIDIPVKYDLTGKFNPLIVRYHNGKAEAFRRLYAAPAKDALKDGTYYVEGTGKNAIVHIYTNRFSTYALLTSGTEEYPKLGDSVTVYRLYYGPTMEHFYTTSAYERRVLIDKYGWVDEGIAWKSPKAPTTDEEKKTIKPVYRLFNPFTTDHHYTKDANERKTLIEKYGWKDEGVAFYSNEKGDATVYRLWHPGLITGAHHFTTGKHEYDVLITRGWIGETEAFKVNAAS